MTQTALDQYAKLEAEARYLDGSGAPAVDVILSFGARSLMIVDFEDRAIAHWPLASLAALSAPGAETLMLAPDRVGPERLEISDPAMIEAIERVCAEMHAAPVADPGARPRRRGRWGLLAVLGALALGAVWLANGADLDGTVAAFVDPATAQDIGARQSVLLAQSLGRGRAVARCVDADGVAALNRLVARVAPDRAAGMRIIVLDHPGADALSLPGGRILLTRGLLISAAAPEEIAGVLAVESARIAQGAPLEEVVSALGLRAKVELAAGAGLDDEGHATVLAHLSAAASGAGAEGTRTATAALRALDDAGLPRGPFQTLMGDLAALGKAYAARRAMVVSAFQGDLPGALAPGTPFQPALDDRNWLALGNICDSVRQLRP